MFTFPINCCLKYYLNICICTSVQMYSAYKYRLKNIRLYSFGYKHEFASFAWYSYYTSDIHIHTFVYYIRIRNDYSTYEWMYIWKHRILQNNIYFICVHNYFRVYHEKKKKVRRRLKRNYLFCKIRLYYKPLTITIQKRNKPDAFKYNRWMLW